MEALYELALDDGTERVIASEQSVGIGDAVVLEDEVWLVVRESEREPARGRARFECRRGLKLQDQARELVTYVEELELKFTQVRDVHAA